MEIKYDEENNYFCINDKIIIDNSHSLIINKLKNKSVDCLECINEIWYYNNYKSKSRLIDLLYPNLLSYKFINNDINDYRSENIEIKYDTRFFDNFTLPKNYTILKMGESYQIKKGKFSGQYRNMYWKVQDDLESFYIMHITDNIYTKFSKRDKDKILNFMDQRPCWFINQNGYVSTTIHKDDKVYNMYLHQYIMDAHNQDITDYEKTIDHINRDKLDNRRSNLRFANMSLQNLNKGKAKRRIDACDLPEGISLPKYVQYRKEIYDKENNSSREFFIVSHPNEEKIWETTKSAKVSISEKLKHAKLKIQLIEKLITQEKYDKYIKPKLDLPVGIRYKDDYGFIFDYKINDNRYSLKRKQKISDINEELNTFIDQINAKYPELKLSYNTIILSQ
jgi:hypothetical protein